MATSGNNLKMPPDLLKLLEAKAATVGKSVHDLAAETLRGTLEEQSWQDLLLECAAAAKSDFLITGDKQL